MKVICIVIMFFNSLIVLCQEQTTSHETLLDVKVLYKAVKTGTVLTGQKQEIKIRPEVEVKLKPTDVKRIYVELYKHDTTLIYKANYSLDTIPFISQRGTKLFSNEGGVYKVIVPDTLLLSDYKFVVFTESSLNAKSSKKIKKR